MSAILTYNDTQFRQTLPYFADINAYPVTVLQQFFTNATSYVSPFNYGWLCGADRQLALYLMTGHLAALGDQIRANDGSSNGVIIGARIDKIDVKLQPPPAKNQLKWWLNQTTWGQQLLALLSAKSAGGWNVGGLPERQAFRRVNGGFGLGRF